MADMDRRDFLLAALSGLGGLGLAGCADVPGLLDAGGRAEQIDTSSQIAKICMNVRTRKNIYCLNESSPDLIAYRAGVAAMKARSASLGNSWQAQRALHYTVGASATAIFNKCEHSTAFFLSWHRMYLYWFERIIRADSGNSSFALPYWGYSPTGARNLPAPFRVPAASTNVLYHASRSWASNNGNQMSASLVDPGLAMLELAFYDFQDELETTPHDSVHNPGVLGSMGSVPTAALDPIFYLHHCNIDRLWSIWLAQGGGRVNPSDSPWLNNVYQFYNENGAVVNMTGAHIVNTANQLCYKYASPKCWTVADDNVFEAEATQVFAVAEPIGPRPPRADKYTLAEEQVSVKLGATPVTVTVPIPAAAQDELAAFADAKEGNRFSLLLQDVVLDQEPSLYYEVYVNLPGDAARAEYTSPHYAGNLTFFSLTMPAEEHQAHAGGYTRRINLLRAYAYLRGSGEWKNDAVQVTFVPRGGFEGEDPARLVAGTQASIGRISLQLQ